jgi:hypothetical protein
MKSVKLMLLGILVVASVGGALAFKAQKGQNLFCGFATNDCPVPEGFDYTITNVDPHIKIEGQDLYCSKTANVNCTFVTDDE